MFGMSLTEIGVIVFIAVVFMGPEKLPEAARFLGKMLREVRKASNLLRDAMDIDLMETAQRHIQPADQAPAVAMRDPDPKHDVRMVVLRDFLPSTSFQTVSLEAAKPVAKPRDVYLHVPYDETI